MAIQGTVLVIEDDEVSREVLELLLSMAGYGVMKSGSGEAALSMLDGGDESPEIVLADLMMPGVRGNELAGALRSRCGDGAVLLAMSASVPEEATWSEFDGFLMKPFTMEAFGEAVARRRTEAGAHEAAGASSCLDEKVYGKLVESMPAAQLEQLYALCLKDAEERLAAMRAAIGAGDDTTFRRQAHTIKGSCSMFGAVKLQNLAGLLEEHGLDVDDPSAAVEEMMGSCSELRRILLLRRQQAAADQQV